VKKGAQVEDYRRTLGGRFSPTIAKWGFSMGKEREGGQREEEGVTEESRGYIGGGLGQKKDKVPGAGRKRCWKV